MQQLIEAQGYKRIIGLTLNAFMPWVVCFAASLFFFYEFIQGYMFASIADNIMQDFHIQVDKMAYLSTAHYLSNVIFLFVAGMFLDRYSTKKTILAAMLLCVASTFALAWTNNFYMALCFRFLTGIGSAFCFLGPIRIASQWFSTKQMALVTGFIVTMAMTGGMLAQYPLTQLVLSLGWRGAVVDVGWLGVILFIVMSVIIVDKPKNDANYKVSEKKSIIATLKIAYLNTQALRAALYTSLMNMGMAVFGAMAGTLFLMERLSVTKTEASMVNTTLFLGAIIGGPFIGWCSDKLGRRVLPMKVGVGASLIVILAILYIPVSIKMMSVLFFSLGFFTSAQVISYALVVESSPADMTATAVSLVSILTQGGYLVYQNIFSNLLVHYSDSSGLSDVSHYTVNSYQAAGIILPIGFILAFMMLTKLKETYCQRTQ